MQSFIEKKKDTQPAFNVGIMLGNKPTKKDVGIEIEVEGKNLIYHGQVPVPWKYVEDHSLRGEENAEYVLKFPIEFDAVPRALDALFEKLAENKATFDDSNRTSVHVHLNCQEFHLNRLTAFIAMWFALEEVLTEWCGEHRVGNLFCLRAVDAPAVITHLKKFIASDGGYPLGEGLRYAALNPNALHKYGSIEIRTLQGCHEPKAIANWVAILARLHGLSKDYPNPTALFATAAPMPLFKLLLGDKVGLVREGCGMTDGQIEAAMFRGIRFAKQLVFCRDWEAYQPLEIQPDPFGRDVRKLAPKIIEAVQGSPEPVNTLSGTFEPEYDSPPDDPSPYVPFSLGAAAAALPQQEVQSVWASVSSDPFFIN